MNQKLSYSLSSRPVLEIKNTLRYRNLSHKARKTSFNLKSNVQSKRNLSLATDTEGLFFESSVRNLGKTPLSSPKSSSQQLIKTNSDNSPESFFSKHIGSSPRSTMTAKSSQRSSSFFSGRNIKSITRKTARDLLKASTRLDNKISDLGHLKTSKKVLHKSLSDSKSVSSKASKDSLSNLDLKNMVTQVRPKMIEKTKKLKSDAIYKEHLYQTCQALKFIKEIQPVTFVQLNDKKVNFPKRPGYENKKTVIFDLDETLVHCNQDYQKPKPDVVLPVKFYTGEIIKVNSN